MTELEYFLLARNSYIQKDYQHALTYLEQCLSLNAHFKEALFGRGTILFSLNRYDEALNDYSKALDIDPNFCEALNGRATIYFRQGLLPEALADHNKTLHLNPYFKEALFGRGTIFFCQKLYDEALTDYRKILSMDPLYREAWLGCGDTYYQLKNYNQSLICFNQALELDPVYKQALLGRGNSYYQLKNYPQALSDYNKALSIDENFKQALNGRGSVLYNLQQYKQALADYDKILTLDPHVKQALNGRGLVLMSLHKYHEAFEDYRKALELDEKFIAALNGLGISSYRLQNYDKALEAFNEALAIDPFFKEALMNLSHTYHKINDYQSAITVLKKITDELDPNDAKAHYRLGLIHRNNRNRKASSSEFQAAYLCSGKKNDLYHFAHYGSLTKNFPACLEGTYKDINQIIIEDPHQARQYIRYHIQKTKSEKPHAERLFNYRQFNEFTIDAIIHNYLYLSDPLGFNDPTDPFYRLINDKKLREHYALSLSDIKMACLSSSPYNMVLWSHYADSHKGICIEYELDNLQIDNPNYVMRPVNYDVKKISQTPDDLFIIQKELTAEQNDDYGLFIDKLFDKAAGWRYEEEYRLITYKESPEECRSRTKTAECRQCNSNEREKFCHAYSKIGLPIKAVYLGKEVSDEYRQIISRIISNKVPVYQVSTKGHNIYELTAEKLESFNGLY